MKATFAFLTIIFSDFCFRQLDLSFLKQDFSVEVFLLNWWPILIATTLGCVTAISLAWLVRRWKPNRRDVSIGLVSIAWVFYISKFLARWMFKALPDGVLGIGEAIGMSSYLGNPKATEYLIFWTTVSLSAAVGILLGKKLKLPSKVATKEPRDGRFQLWFLVGFVLLFAVAIFPNYSAFVEVLKHPIETGNYDSLNVLSWRYFVAKGWLPFRDFWYPYGGTYNESGPFPADQLRLFVRSLGIFAVFVGSIYSILRFSIDRTLVLCTMVGYFVLSGVIFAWNRYFFALDMVLLFFAAKGATKHRRLWFAFAGLFGAWVFTYEPNQLIYSGIPIFLISSGNLVRIGWAKSRNHRGELLVFGLALIFGILANLIWLGLRGQLPGFFEFYQNAHTMGVFASLPSGITGWYSIRGGSAQLFASTHIMVIVGCYLYFRQSKTDRMAELIVAIALLTCLGFQKQLVRPHMAEQLIGFQIVGWLVLVCHVSRSWDWRRNGVALMATCVFVGQNSREGLPLGRMSEFQSNVANFLSSIRDYCVETLPPELAPVHFYEKKLSVPGVDFGAIGGMIGRSIGSTDGPAFYVFGDQAYFYILFGEKPPFNISLYDGSPIQHQKKTVQWLDSNRVENIIWYSKATTFDYVPNVVRNPLVYDYVVSNFLPIGVSGDFEILKRRSANSISGRTGVLEVDYWLKKLGNAVDLRQVPILAEEPSDETCEGRSGVDCFDYARIDLGAGYVGKNFQIALEARGRTFSVQCDVREDRRTYYVNLDRIWFWSAFRKLDLNPSLISGDQGSSIKVIHGPALPDRLY